MKPDSITNENRLRNYLGIDLTSYDALTNNDYVVINDLADPDSILKPIRIRRIQLSKKRGGIRTVYGCESDVLSNTLKILNTKISTLYDVPISVHGFVRGRNIKTNAVPHLTKKYVLVIDIKDYFESIEINTVRKAFEGLGFNKLISEKLSNIVTYQGKLIQGFHTSPTLANIVFQHIDIELEKLHGSVTYTRYADDLYFSSDTEFDIEDDVRQILMKNAFEINPKKTKMMRRGWHQYVTGLTVFDNIRPRIPKRIKKWLRLEIYYIHQFGYLEHVLHRLQVSRQDYNERTETKNKVDSEIAYLQRRLDGWLLFINSIEPEFAKKKSKLLEESLENFPL